MFSIPSLVKKCPDCDQQFATKTTLNIHRLKVHVAGLQNLPCPQCGQEAADLTSHMRRHHKVEGIVCPHCANIFSKKCTLNRHIEQVSAKKERFLIAMIMPPSGRVNVSVQKVCLVDIIEIQKMIICKSNFLLNFEGWLV